MPHQLAVVKVGAATLEGAVVGMQQQVEGVADSDSRWHSSRRLVARDLGRKGHWPLTCSSSCLQKSIHKSRVKQL